MPYVPVQITRGALVAVYLFDSSLQNLYSTAGLLILPVSMWNDPADHEFDGVGLAGFKSRAIAILLA